MLEITCSGTPYEIGLAHGHQAALLVHGSIQFYKEYFQRKSKLDWDEASAAASRFQPILDEHVPHLVEEMRGIADGANVPFLSVLALNVRSEIAMGLMEDGCTALAWTTDAFSVCGQNWDWEDAQKDNLVLVHICPAPDTDHPKPKISQVTEAGIVGKIGLNAHGVSVFLNAIRAPGVNYNALPLHISLRVALEAQSRAEAVARLLSIAPGGAAGTSGHILIVDGTSATSLEFTAVDVVIMDTVGGQIAHTNHFVAKHSSDAPSNTPYTHLPDTYSRQARIMELLGAAKEALPEGTVVDTIQVRALLSDEVGLPTAINRCSSLPDNRSSTLFNIVIDARARTAVVKEGRPTDDGPTLLISMSK